MVVEVHFFFTSMGVAYVLATSKPAEKEDEYLDETRKHNKWQNDNYICCGHILNGMFNELFDVYQFNDSAKSLWDELEAKYMVEDASSKKFLVSKFNNFKFVESRPIMEQFHEIQRILGSLRQHDIILDETFVVSSIVDKFPFSWKDFKSGLKHRKDDVNLEGLTSHIRIEEEIRVQEGNKDANPSSTTVNIVEDASPNVRKRGNDSNKNKGKNPKFSGDSSKSRACWANCSWYIDSGASRHVCKDRSLFKTFLEVDA
ncbi:uncharacterized protein LOC110726199 [Chenopodium quinoa]|uniref:uncharacterized protein LOC110726199 n=1 Tax=Chenopodium quinoa TaxID=63459 RepID=UPI000B79828E|nr:uncharacterized protein LOC110726199 [Chenopodium quinoa]